MITNDLKFAARTLRKNPAFTLTAVLTIALGIGASTAIFSVVNGVLLRPLPYPHPDRLATIQTDMLARNVKNFPIAPGAMPDVWTKLPAFESIAAISSGRVTYVSNDGKPDEIVGAQVTTNFFNTLGARVVFGRNFAESDGTPAPPRPQPGPNAAPADPSTAPLPMVVLGYEFWQHKFSGDSSLIGKTIQLNGGPAQVIGVAEPGLKLAFNSGNGIAEQPDLYTALRVDWSTASRNNVFLRLIARLKPNSTWAEADAQMRNLTADEQARFPIAKTANVLWRAQPMAVDIVKDVRPAILALMGAVMFVLLIACANVANLLLVRASARERELAVRAALGGNRRTLVGQMLAESFVLSASGAVLGLFFARLGIDLLVRIAPSTLPRLDDVSIDPVVLVFAAAAAVASAFIFGILPALRASRPNLAQTLRAGGRTPGLHGAKSLRNAVVVAEVALSFVLLIGSGLMLRSFMALAEVDPGFDPKGVLTFTANNQRARSRQEGQAYEDALAKRLAAIPGVTGVTAASPLPLDGLDFNMRYGTQEAASDNTKFKQATIHIVRPDYFKTMKTRILAGNDFSLADMTPGAHALIIDDVLAAKAFPGVPLNQVVGKSLLARLTAPEAEPYPIIAVAQHQRHLTLSEPGREAIFIAEGALGPGAAARWAVRTSGDPTRIGAEVRRAVAEIEPQVAIGEMKPMSDYISRAMAPTRFSLVLIAVFGAVAALLAAVGLYGVLSTTVRQRTSEIGVRLAFGATSQNIFRLIVGQGMVLSGIGILTGLVAAAALTGFMQKASMLVSVTPTDPPTYAAIAALFLGIATLSCWLPARRASRLDPNAALREE